MLDELTLLLANGALIAVFVGLWSGLGPRVRDLSDDWAPLVFGLLAGIASALLILMPFAVTGEIEMDLRTVPVGLAAFFGGPLAAIGSAFVPVFWLILEGDFGIGAKTIGLVLTAVVASALHLRGNDPTGKPLRIVGLSALAATLPLVALLLVPAHLRIPEFIAQIPILSGAIFLFTLLGGVVLCRELRRQEQDRVTKLYRAIVEKLPDSLYVKDADGILLAANPAAAALIGLPGPKAMIGRSVREVFPETANLDIGASATPVFRDRRLRHADGSDAWVSTAAIPLTDNLGRHLGLIVHNRDITAQKTAERQLEQSQKRLSDALSNMADGLVMFDRNRKLVFCNEQYRRMFSKTADLRIPGASLHDIVAASVARGEQLPVAEGDASRARADLLDIGTREIHLWDGRWLEARTRYVQNGSLIVFSDITESKRTGDHLRDLNARLQELTRSCPLTGLANRRAFDEALVREFGRCGRIGAPVSLIFLDLDHFDRLAKRQGQEAANAALARIGACLARVCKRSTDLVSRYDSDQLAVLLSDTAAAGALQCARDLRDALRQLAIPHQDNPPSAILTASIGIATLVPGPGTQAADLVTAADGALDRARNDGRDRIAEALEPALRSDELPRQPIAAIAG